LFSSTTIGAVSQQALRAALSDDEADQKRTSFKSKRGMYFYVLQVPDSQKDILSFILKLLKLSCKSYFFNAFLSKMHCNFVLQETQDTNCCKFAS